MRSSALDSTLSRACCPAATTPPAKRPTSSSTAGIWARSCIVRSRRCAKRRQPAGTHPRSSPARRKKKFFRDRGGVFDRLSMVRDASTPNGSLLNRLHPPVRPFCAARAGGAGVRASSPDNIYVPRRMIVSDAKQSRMPRERANLECRRFLLLREMCTCSHSDHRGCR